MKISRLIAIGASALALTATAACSDGNGSASSSGDGGTEYTVGIVQFSASDQASETAIKAYMKEAKKLGWDVSKVDPQGSVDKAISAMNDYVQKDVDLLIVSVFPSETLTAGVRTAKAAGIPVMSIVGGTADGVPVSADAGPPNATEGAKLLVDDLGRKGEVLVLGYSSGLPCKGREDELNKYLDGTDINITRHEIPIPGEIEAATQFTQAWLAKHPKDSTPMAVWGCFDGPSLGAIAALRQANRDDVFVYGINGLPPAIAAVKSGNMRATAYVDAAKVGRQFVEMTPDVVKAGPDAPAQDVPIPSFLVTSESYDAFIAEYPEAAAK